jgi:uncharacterized cupin superfamily protein
MQPTIVSGVSVWSRWQPDRQLYFNSWFVESPAGNFVVDPLDPDDSEHAHIMRHGIAAVVVTNRDHERAAELVSERYGVPVIAPKLDAHEMNVDVTREVDDGDDVFGWRVVRFDGMKSRGESALFRAEDRTAITGDAFWGVPAGGVTLMADDKLGDPLAAALSTRKLLALDVQHLLVGDGAPVYFRAWDALVTMLEAREGVFFRRVNVDELHFAPRHVPAGYARERAEISWFLGVRRLGYAAVRLGPGESTAPFHGHTLEEELCWIVDGHPTIRTPAGKHRLRPGDLVALPVGPPGAHRLVNESEQRCIAVFIANVAEGDAGFYPDSHKVMFDRYRSRLILRDNPALEYFDGELDPH